MERQRGTRAGVPYGVSRNGEKDAGPGRRPSPRARLRGGDRQQGGAPGAAGHAGRARVSLAARSRQEVARRKAKDLARRAAAALSALFLVLSQLLGLGLAAAPATTALAEDLGTLTVAKATSYSDFDDVNDSFSRMHHFEVNSEDGIAYCGAKSLHSPEAGRVFTGGYVSNNPALDWIMCHGWSPTHQTEYGLSSSHFMMATQYVVWFALPHSYETNDHDWAESELTRIYTDVADAVAKMRAESDAYVAAGGGGPEAGSSIIWPSPDDATQSLVTRRTPQVEVAMQKGSADASLTFGNDAYSLAGATYEIRQCADDALAATVTTDATGRASCSLRPGVRYYAQETRAPAGYLLASGRVEFEAKAGQVVGLDDVPATAEVRVQKVDSSTGGAAQPGASLAGAELTLIDAQGRTHVSTTDAEGRASFDGLPLGRVRVTESRAPEGYKASQQVLEAEATAAQVGQNGIASISMESALKEDVVSFDLEIAKFKDYGQEGSGLEQPAGGVRFQVISNTTGGVVGELVTNPYGFADTSADSSLWFGTGTRAPGVHGALPYDAGGYTIHEVESTVPAGFSHIGDWTISAQQMADGAKLQYIADNHALATRLQVVKRDASSGQVVALPGFAFQILDADGNPLTQESWYPNHVTLDRFVTDESGCVTLPQSLVPGTYYIHEVAAQAPYLVRGEAARIDVPADATLPPVVIASLSDEQASGSAKLTKTSESGTPLAGAEFDVVAQQDVVAPDRTIQAVEGQVVAHVSTDEKGEATVEGLPLGAGEAGYAFVETLAPEGFVLDETPHEFTVCWEDQQTAVVWAEAEAQNALAVGSASIRKTDLRTGATLAGAEFDVVATADVVDYDGSLAHEAGDVVAHVSTDENGMASADGLALSPGGAGYAFVETAAPAGYVVDPTPHEFTIGYQDQLTPVVTVEAMATNDFTTVRLSKLDEKGEHLAGAHLALLDANKEVVDSWVSDEVPHTIERLLPGAYTLAESEAPEGYLKADPIDFTVAEVTDVQEVSMTDLRIPTPQELPSTGEGLPIGAVLAGISAGCAFMGYLLVRRG